jgi:hypothetical protein
MSTPTSTVRPTSRANLATVVFDVEALGDNTFTEMDLNVLTTDKSSSIVGSAISAASSGDGKVKIR